MDAETKRRIDNARDTLVGKVTDPKGQVEQITIALTYKFMDDMDLEAVRLGGKRTFFAGNFEPYAWSKLMDPAVNAQHMHRLYSDGIERMSENPGAAPLFRTIFVNAFLPYNDPSTLQQFLRIINEFEYDNSEALGDAYEYLTSIMGSQGDAGQFRTPRHIIDFIVDIVDPQIGESILDPACGTGGFLISAYKHILAANTDSDGSRDLTPSQQAKLADSLTGYDIDPGMVRIALLNLYLHSLVDPHIFEYDTLTSEERWNRYADVIIANPPFMTPKGGIRPHSKFSVQSKRSEVLFVDYMAEHLTTNGRAGIIVPEGIIFQTQNAHKQLRKMLVDDYLVAVISLPGGVFNPYSGVKTSILILDKALARKSASIGFFKVTNDGYDLGAQRRPIDKDDLPQIRADVQEYLSRARSGEPTSDSQPETGNVVPREKIAADGEYNLSGERYRVRTVRSAKWPMVRLGDVTVGKPQYGSSARKVAFDGRVRYVRITDLTDSGQLLDNEVVSPSEIDCRYFLVDGDLLVARTGSVGRAYLHSGDIGTYQFAGYLIRFQLDKQLVLPKFAFGITRSDHWRDWIESNTKTGTLGNINAKQYSSFEFPLPPLEVQREVVEEIEIYQRVIDGAQMVVENWRPRIEVDPAWPVVELGEVCEVNPDKVVPDAAWPGQIIRYIDISSVENHTGNIKQMTMMTAEDAPTRARRGVKAHDVLLSTVRPNLRAFTKLDDVRDRDVASTGFAVLRPSNGSLSPDFLLSIVKSDEAVEQMTAMMGKGAYPSINQSDVRTIRIPLPPLEVQEATVHDLNNESRAVNANRELITSMKARVRDAVARVWG